MKSSALLALLLVLFMPASLAQAQSDEPQHLSACAACHGTDGISIAPGIPNLAAQREDYLRAQLQAYRDGSRENALMNALTAALSNEHIDGLAAYFASQAGPVNGEENSAMLPELLTPDFPFADDYENSFTYYRTIYPGNQVRHYYANEVAVTAVRAGQNLPDGSYILIAIHAAARDGDGDFILDDNGQRIAGELQAYNVMAREPGWGDQIPGILRNENWRYANLDAQGRVNMNANQAACLACHVPLAEDSFLFSIDDLQETALSSP